MESFTESHEQSRLKTLKEYFGRLMAGINAQVDAVEMDFSAGSPVPVVTRKKLPDSEV